MMDGEEVFVFVKMRVSYWLTRFPGIAHLDTFTFVDLAPEFPLSHELIADYEDVERYQIDIEHGDLPPPQVVTHLAPLTLQ
jgi:hypothetical protein